MAGRFVVFVETVGHQLLQCVECFRGLFAFAAQVQFGAGAGGQHHHFQNIFAVAELVRRMAQPDFAWKSGGQTGKTGGSAGMQAALVTDGQSAAVVTHGVLSGRASR